MLQHSSTTFCKHHFTTLTGLYKCQPCQIGNKNGSKQSSPCVWVNLLVMSRPDSWVLRGWGQPVAPLVSGHPSQGDTLLAARTWGTRVGYQGNKQIACSLCQARRAAFCTWVVLGVADLFSCLSLASLVDVYNMHGRLCTCIWERGWAFRDCYFKYLFGKCCCFQQQFFSPIGKPKLLLSGSVKTSVSTGSYPESGHPESYPGREGVGLSVICKLQLWPWNVGYLPQHYLAEMPVDHHH